MAPFLAPNFRILILWRMGVSNIKLTLIALIHISDFIP